MRKPENRAFAYAKKKTQTSCSVVTKQLICTFCFRYIDSTIPLLRTSEISLAIFCGCTGYFVLDLVRNAEDRFSCNMAHMSLVMRKPAFCICENKDADQLRGNREADQRLCFRLSLVFLNPKCQASSGLLCLYSLVCVGPGRKPRRPVFSERGPYMSSLNKSLYLIRTIISSVGLFVNEFV